MEQPLRTGASAPAAPTFYITARQPPRPAALLLALVTAAAGVFLISQGLGHTHNEHTAAEDSKPARSTASGSTTPDKDNEDKDDPSQVDTIVLGDAADAPVPARRSDHVSAVHATILIRLPRYGDQVGLIPDIPSGHLLYQWLAAFNQASQPALANVLPNDASASTADAQMALRQQTGGLKLLSAKEAQPGILVFRLRDQTPEANEVLGTLQMRPGSKPPAIESFSLRAIAQPHPGTIKPAATSPQ